jgi:hypothetical protein
MMPYAPKIDPFLNRAGWIALALFALIALVIVPSLFVFVPEESPFHVSAYTVTLVGKIMCYCIVAVAMNLIWGYAGILSLGHGVFFALGGYAFGMYLMRQIGRDGQYQSDLPDFMVFLDWKEYPWQWAGTDHFLWALALVILVPGVLAFVFGFFAFRSRIKGVYFSIITQAMTFAFMLLFFRNETHSRFSNYRTADARDSVCPECGCIDRCGAAVALSHSIQDRAYPHGDTRFRIAPDVLRLQPARLQAVRVDALGGDVRHCRRLVCAASGHHQSQ